MNAIKVFVDWKKQEVALNEQTLNEHLKNNNDCAAQRKMSVNVDPARQVQGVIFSHKMEKPHHLLPRFNNTYIKQTTS